jgi:uncharacterized protein YecA (UPF0149 family)
MEQDSIILKQTTQAYCKICGHVRSFTYDSKQQRYVCGCGVSFGKYDFMWQVKVVKFVEEFLKHPYEFLKALRNTPCPCGSGKKFKKCHMQVVDLIKNSRHSFRHLKDNAGNSVFFEDRYLG